MEYFWRHRILYPFLKRIMGRQGSETPVDLTKVKKILFLRHDRIGDMIVTTPIFRTIRQQYPLLKIGVLAAETNEEIIRYNKAIDVIHILQKRRIKRFFTLLKIRHENYDVVVNFIFNRTTSIALLLNFIAKKSITVSQGDEKYRFYFNRYCTLPRSVQPMTYLYADMMRIIFSMRLKSENLKYEIVVDNDSRAHVAGFLFTHDVQVKSDAQCCKYIVFNLSASIPKNKISKNQAGKIIALLNLTGGYRIVLVTAPEDKEMRAYSETVCRTTNCIRFMQKGYGSLLELAALIESASLVLSPDTSIIHFASAMKTPVIGFFTPLQGMKEWFPFNVKHTCVIAQQGQPVSNIPIDQITEEISIFLDKILKK